MQQSRGATERRGIVQASGAAATQVGSGARAGRGQGCSAGLQRGSSLFSDAVGIAHLLV